MYRICLNAFYFFYHLFYLHIDPFHYNSFHITSTAFFICNRIVHILFQHIKDCESQWNTTILFTLEHSFIANKIRLLFTMEEGCSLYSSKHFIHFHRHHELTWMLLTYHVLLKRSLVGSYVTTEFSSDSLQQQNSGFDELLLYLFQNSILPVL